MNRFVAKPFNINIFPYQSFANINRMFASDSGSLEFLAKNNFDFNQWVYSGNHLLFYLLYFTLLYLLIIYYIGITYLNQDEEKQLKEKNAKLIEKFDANPKITEFLLLFIHLFIFIFCNQSINIIIII